MEQEEAMARELERIKLESLRDEKMRQQIRENRWLVKLSLFHLNCGDYQYYEIVSSQRN